MIIDNFLKYFGYEKKASKSKKPNIKNKREIMPWSEVPEQTGYFPSASNTLGEMPPDMNESDYLRSATGWVHSCISAICDEVAGIELKLYKRSGNKVEEVLDHEALDLLFKVNDFTTKFDHFWLTQEYLELAGEAPWALERISENSPPTSIYLLKPDRLTIKWDKKNVIGGYKYEVDNGKFVEFQPWEIIFLKYPDPNRPFRGRGTLASAASTYNLDKYSEEWNLRFFYNSARPDSILSVKNKLSEQQIARLEKAWNKKFSGIDKVSKLAILQGDMDFKIMQLSQKDMDFVEQQKFSRDKLFSIFRVPKSVVAVSDDVNRANAETGAYTFARWTIKPKMKKIVEQLNEFYIPMFGDDLYLDFEDPVPENVKAKLDKYENALKNGWMTINEVRDKEGLKPINGGDEIYLPLNLVSVGSSKRDETPKKSIKKNIRFRKKQADEKEVSDNLMKIIKYHSRKVKKKSKKGK